MPTYSLDSDEVILLTTDGAIWSSRDKGLIEFALTNKRLLCTYEKSGGLFKWPTEETSCFLLSDIKMHNGRPMVQQVRHDGYHCLQIQFTQSVEYFTFRKTEKKAIIRWIVAIHDALGFPLDPPLEAEDKKHGSLAAMSSKLKRSKEKFIRQCPSCGANVIGGAAYCSNCGYKIDTSDEDSQSAKNESACVAQDHSANASSEEESAGSPLGTSSAVRREEYVGTVRKCPHCGEPIESFAGYCSACGAEVKEATVSKHVERFARNLQEKDVNKIEEIRSFLIPSAKEDLFEFALVAAGSVKEIASKEEKLSKEDEELLAAWKSKMEECLEKGRLILNQRDCSKLEGVLGNAQNAIADHFNSLEQRGRKLSESYILVAVASLLLYVVALFIVIGGGNSSFVDLLGSVVLIYSLVKMKNAGYRGAVISLAAGAVAVIIGRVIIGIGGATTAVFAGGITAFVSLFRLLRGPMRQKRL